MPIHLLFSVNIKNVKQQKKKDYVLIVYKLCQMPIYMKGRWESNICLVPIYVFPEMKLRGLIISKTEL